MNEGKIAIVITDNCSRFFKGDRVRILRHFESSDTYYVQRVEGYICGEVKPDDIKLIKED